jgi:hypothetical protein
MRQGQGISKAQAWDYQLPNGLWKLTKVRFLLIVHQVRAVSLLLSFQTAKWFLTVLPIFQPNFSLICYI